MKFYIASDLHGSTAGLDLTSKTSDYLICAGDVSEAKKSNYKKVLQELSQAFKHVFIVLGNHEFYDSNIASTKKYVTNICSTLPNVTLLDDSTTYLEVEGKKIVLIGGTLWSDFAIDPMSKYIARMNMNDYRYIRFGPESEPWRRKLTPDDTEMFHKFTKDFITSELEKYDACTKIVVTHHACSTNSIPAQFVGSSLNAAYCSDLSELILEKKPDYWIHGHIHEHKDYHIGDTRVLCNPVGYNGESTKYILNFFIEI